MSALTEAVPAKRCCCCCTRQAYSEVTAPLPLLLSFEGERDYVSKHKKKKISGKEVLNKKVRHLEELLPQQPRDEANV